MKKTIIINKIDGSQEKKIIAGDNFQAIKEKIMKTFPIIDAQMLPNENKPGQYWIGWGAFEQDIVSVTMSV